MRELLTDGVALWYNPIVHEARRQGKVLRSGEFQRAADFAENAVFLTAGKTPESGGDEWGKTRVVSDG